MNFYKKKIYCVFSGTLLLGILFSGGALHADTISLEEAIEKNQDQQVANFMGPGFAPNDKQFAMLLKFARSKKNFRTRRKFIQFQKNNLYVESIEWKDRIADFCTIELQFVKTLHPHSQDDVNSIKSCIELAAIANLKDMFHDIASFVVYPLYGVRKETQKTFVAWRDDRALGMLVSLVDSSNPLERVYAIDALMALADPRVVPIFLKTLEDKNKSVRLYSMQALEQLGRKEVHRKYIKMINDDPDCEVRQKALETIMKYRYRNAIQAILRSVSDESERVRKTALIALEPYRYKSSTYYVSQQLAVEPKNYLKRLQIEFLIRAENSGGMKGLNTILLNETNLELRLLAVYAAGRVKDMRGFDALEKNLAHVDVKIRSETALSMGNLGSEKGVLGLLSILRNEKEPYFVRSAALFGLERINANSSIGALHEIQESINDKIFKEQVHSVLQNMLENRYK